MTVMFFIEWRRMNNNNICMRLMFCQNTILS